MKFINRFTPEVAMLVAVIIILALIVWRAKTDAFVPNQNFSISIDGCEYLVWQNSSRALNNYSFAITHKGNCSNLIHANKP